MVTSKLNRFLVKVKFPSGVDYFGPTFFVIMYTFSNEILNVRARKAVKVPDVSRHSKRRPSLKRFVIRQVTRNQWGLRFVEKTP